VGCGREGDLQMNTHKNSKTSIDDWFVGGIAGTRKIEHSSIKYCTYATNQRRLPGAVVFGFRVSRYLLVRVV
jgi:hypothetical protein